MFDLFSGERRRAPHGKSTPVLISTAAHVLLLGLLLAIPMVYLKAELPAVPDMMAFVVSVAPPPPPPPPPAPPASKPATVKKMVKPVPTVNRQAAPVEAPPQIVEQMPPLTDSEEGVQGGIEGGIPGGILGGVEGGLSTELPPPPPPAPVPVVREPLRVGGDLRTPALVERVAPEYPLLAVRAHVQGVVILEAIVDREGRVENVSVLRSIPLLDKAAVDAVRKWRYSPLMLNGKPERFVLTVTVSFSLST